MREGFSYCSNCTLKQLSNYYIRYHSGEMIISMDGNLLAWWVLLAGLLQGVSVCLVDRVAHSRSGQNSISKTWFIQCDASLLGHINYASQAVWYDPRMDCSFAQHGCLQNTQHRNYIIHRPVIMTKAPKYSISFSIIYMVFLAFFIWQPKMVFWC